jgi:hypothetical protein
LEFPGFFSIFFNFLDKWDFLDLLCSFSIFSRSRNKNCQLQLLKSAGFFFGIFNKNHVMKTFWIEEMFGMWHDFYILFRTLGSKFARVSINFYFLYFLINLKKKFNFKIVPLKILFTLQIESKKFNKKYTILRSYGVLLACARVLTKCVYRTERY